MSTVLNEYTYIHTYIHTYPARRAVVYTIGRICSMLAGLIGFNPRQLNVPLKAMSFHATDLDVYYADSSSYSYSSFSSISSSFFFPSSQWRHTVYRRGGDGPPRVTPFRG